jgi:hypothetical protein
VAGNQENVVEGERDAGAERTHPEV